MSYYVVRCNPDGSREFAESNPHETREAAEQHAERLRGQESAVDRDPAQFEIIAA
jgi:hypothetical protein